MPRRARRNTKGEAGVLLGVDAAVDKNVGVDHAAAQDLDPAAVLAEVAALAAADVAATSTSQEGSVKGKKCGR